MARKRNKADSYRIARAIQWAAPAAEKLSEEITSLELPMDIAAECFAQLGIYFQYHHDEIKAAMEHDADTEASE